MRVAVMCLVALAATAAAQCMAPSTENEFTADTPSSTAISMRAKTVTIDGRGVKVQVWVTPAQERFRATSRPFYNGAKGVLLVYDITNQTSFDNLGMWLQELRNHLSASPVFVLVGNKSDLEHMRAVKTETASRFAREHGMSFMETSALRNANVEEAFKHLVRAMHEVSPMSGAEAAA